MTRRRKLHIGLPAGVSRRFLAFSTLGLVVAGAGGGAWALAGNNGDDNSTPTVNKSTQSSIQADDGFREKDNSDTSTSAGNSSHTTTTIEINGNKTVVEGNGSIRKNYTEQNGNSTSHIDISVENNSTSETTSGKEQDME